MFPNLFSVLPALGLLVSTTVAAPIARSTEASALFPRSGGIITIVNKSSGPRTFKVEVNANNPAGTYGAGIGQIPPIIVPAGDSHDQPVGSGWSGAISDKDGSGTRFEFTIDGWLGMSWYNTDFEYGMSDATVEPADGVQRPGNPPPGPARAGEQDYLATAKAGWLKLNAGQQQELLGTGYVHGAVGGAMESVRMDNSAPECLVHFLQSVARVRAYVNPGSVAGKPDNPDALIANKFSWSAQTDHFVITAYD